MARIETDPNYSSPTFSRATAATDIFKKEDVQLVAAALSTHDHSTGKGLSLPNGAITSAMIADGAVSQSAFTSAVDSQSTTGSSQTAIPNSSVTLTTTGGPVLVWVGVPLFNNGATTTAYVSILQDGAPTIVASLSLNNARGFAGGSLRFAPAAGAHTYAIGFATTAGTLFVVTDAARSILALEMKK